MIRPPAVLKIKLFDIDLHLDSGSVGLDFKLRAGPLEPCTHTYLSGGVCSPARDIEEKIPRNSLILLKKLWDF